jgi:glycerol-3-phosphate acyltransferase PlsY
MYFSIFISILVLFTHKPNIYRLLSKNENKMNIKLKKNTGN